ncbi:MAG: ABC transporter permease [Armatimonadetes bacterium]|nr:ABC transporter permease [Armatimonadota bacterium]
MSVVNRVFPVLESNLRAIWARAYVRIVGQNRELSWIFFDVCLPLLSMASYVYVYRSLKAPQEFTGYVILGGAMTAYWLNVLWGMAAQLYWEKETANLELFLISPISRVSILMGMALGGFYVTTIRTISSVLLGAVVFGVKFHFDQPFMTLAMFFATLAALYALGMMGSSLFLLYGREAWHMSNMLQEPVYLLSGFYFPIKSLGFWIAASASIIPIALGLDGMRQLLFPGAEGHGFFPAGPELLVVTLLGILYFMLAVRFLAFMERLAKREGRLTLRWQ